MNRYLLVSRRYSHLISPYQRPLRACSPHHELAERRQGRVWTCDLPGERSVVPLLLAVQVCILGLVVPVEQEISYISNKPSISQSAGEEVDVRHSLIELARPLAVRDVLKMRQAKRIPHWSHAPVVVRTEAAGLWPLLRLQRGVGLMGVYTARGWRA